MTATIPYANLIATFGDPIDTTTVAGATTSFDIIRVPEEAQRKARFRWPVMLTLGMHDQCVAWTDKEGLARRLDALLHAARIAAASSSNGAPVSFRFAYLPCDLPLFEAEEWLTVGFGHDGDGKPLVLIRFPWEN